MKDTHTYLYYQQTNKQVSSYELPCKVQALVPVLSLVLLQALGDADYFSRRRSWYVLHEGQLVVIFGNILDERYDSLDSKSAFWPSPTPSFVATKARQWRPVFDASVSVLFTRMNWHDEWIPLKDIQMDQNRPVMPWTTNEMKGALA